jgi:hypothetical protein
VEEKWADDPGAGFWAAALVRAFATAPHQLIVLIARDDRRAWEA